ncbi:MAG: hypothetical protein DRJ67_11120 [Thermoprotei archaeon]|mgnify:CR=1 FL=1|nr:MAG: hypothetical protein DRJ67_11120 [Thermoprotei archaeon]
MSSYADLQSVFRRELESGEVLGLDADFYERARAWLAELEERASKGGLEAEALRLELEMAKETLRRLFLLRLIKELNYLWRHGKKPDVALPREEARLLDQVVATLSEVAGPSARPAGPREVGLAIVAFRKPYSRVMLPGGGVLGPFSAGDVAIVPRAVALELKRLGVAEVVAELS